MKAVSRGGSKTGTKWINTNKSQLSFQTTLKRYSMACYVLFSLEKLGKDSKQAKFTHDNVKKVNWYYSHKP